MECKEQTSVVVRGLLVPTNWSIDGYVTSFGLAAFGEQDYILEFPSALESYETHLRKEVEVQGVITCGAKGKKVIKINKIKLVGN